MPKTSRATKSHCGKGITDADMTAMRWEKPAVLLTSRSSRGPLMVCFAVLDGRHGRRRRSASDRPRFVEPVKALTFCPMHGKFLHRRSAHRNIHVTSTRIVRLLMVKA